jgi:hypothetical protein
LPNNTPGIGDQLNGAQAVLDGVFGTKEGSGKNAACEIFGILTNEFQRALGEEVAELRVRGRSRKPPGNPRTAEKLKESRLELKVKAPAEAVGKRRPASGLGSHEGSLANPSQKVKAFLHQKGSV